ncbi:MAG: TIGR00725 family protein [Candidatus Binatia bacterium]
MIQRDRSLQISVIGGSDPDRNTVVLAEQVGKAVAAKGAVLICGGLGGVMEAAARGAKEKGGLTVGILPGYDAESANRFIDVLVPTGLGHARNMLVAASGDLIIALPGSHGTRSEVSIALLLGRRVIGLKAWGEISGVRQVDSLEELEKELLPTL